MKLELSQGRKIMLYIAAILVGFCGIAEMAINPVIEGIIGTYGYDFMGSYVISAPTLWMAIAALACAPLMGKFTKKKLLIVGVAIFAISANIATLTMDVTYYAVMRSLMGVGEGITNTVILAYLAQLFIDESKHAWFVGIWNLFFTVFSMIFSTMGGFLPYMTEEWAMMGGYWPAAFWCFLPAIVVFIVVAIFLPELGMEEEKNWGEEAGAAKRPFGGAFWGFLVSWLLFSLAIGFYFYYESSYVIENGMGDYSTVGIYMAAMSGMGILVSLVFGKVFMKLKKVLAVFCCACAAVGLLLMAFCPGDQVLAGWIPSILLGLGYGAFYPYIYVMIIEIVPPERIDQGIALSTGLYSVMFFSVSFIVNGVCGSMGLIDMTHFTPIVTPIVIGFAVLPIISLVIELATMGAYKKASAQWALPADAKE